MSLPASRLSHSGRRLLHQVPDLPQNRVAVLGAAGALGQALALLLKRSAFVSDLALYDQRDTRGVGADLSHVSTKARVSAYTGPSQLPDCLRGSSIVVLLAGSPRRPGMCRGDLFHTNAATVAALTSAVAGHCPEAQLCVLTSPLNSNVPLAAEILRRRGVHDPRRLFGVTAVDSVRASLLMAQRTGQPLDKVRVPVLGGHSGSTLVPAFSQAAPHHPQLPQSELRAMTEAVRGAADAVVAAKAGAGSATLSVAAAAQGFIESLLLAMDGKPDIVEAAFVESDAAEVPFFASPLVLGQDGVERSLGVGHLSEFEAALLRSAVRELGPQIDKGLRFGRTWQPGGDAD